TDRGDKLLPTVPVARASRAGGATFAARERPLGIVVVFDRCYLLLPQVCAGPLPTRDSFRARPGGLTVCTLPNRYFSARDLYRELVCPRRTRRPVLCVAKALAPLGRLGSASVRYTP